MPKGGLLPPRLSSGATVFLFSSCCQRIVGTEGAHGLTGPWQHQTTEGNGSDALDVLLPMARQGAAMSPRRRQTCPRPWQTCHALGRERHVSVEYRGAVSDARREGQYTPIKREIIWRSDWFFVFIMLSENDQTSRSELTVAGSWDKNTEYEFASTMGTVLTTNFQGESGMWEC